MMAKMFYRFDEARQVLGMTDEQLRQLTREGKLREFRDGTQVMYKADQVDTLKREMGIGGESVDLGPSDTGGPIGLVDSRGESAGGSVISLSDTTSKDDTAADMSLSGSGGLSGSGSGSGIDLTSSQSNTGIGLAGTGGSKSGTKGGTSIGLASSQTGTGIGLASSTAGGSVAGGSLSGSLGGTKMGSKAGSGVSVLGLDEGGSADANAATAMGGSFGGDPGMEPMGSGSGLLDLSRERDDTSLGAPVLREFNAGSSGGSKSGSGGAISGAPLSASPVVASGRSGVPTYVEEASDFAGFAAGASAGAALFALVAIYCIASATMRADPTLLSFMNNGTKTTPMLYVLGAGLIASLLFGGIGYFLGKRR